MFSTSEILEFEESDLKNSVLLRPSHFFPFFLVNRDLNSTNFYIKRNIGKTVT